MRFCTTGKNSPPGHPKNHLPPDWKPVAGGEEDTRWRVPWATGARGAQVGACVVSHEAEGSPVGVWALRWVLKTLQGNPGPHSGTPCGGQYVSSNFGVREGLLSAPLLPGPHPPAVLPVLPAQRHWTLHLFPPPAFCPPALAQAGCPWKPPSDPPPATCLRPLSPVWLGRSLACCSLSGIPHRGLSNSWHPGNILAQSRLLAGCCWRLAAGGWAAPGTLSKEREWEGFSPHPIPAPRQKSQSEPRSCSASYRKSSSPGLCFNQRSSDRNTALPFPRAATLFFFPLLAIGKRIGGLTEKGKLSVKRSPPIPHGKDCCERWEGYHPEF